MSASNESEVAGRGRVNDLRARRDAERNAVLVQTADDAIVSVDANELVESWNAAAEQLLGHVAAQAIGLPLRELLVLDDPDVLVMPVDLQEGRAVRREAVCSGGNARGVRVAITFTPHLDATGALIGVSLVLRDIEKGARVEAALRDRSHFLQRVTAVTPSVVYIMNIVDLGITWVNPQVATVMGYSVSDILEMGSTFMPRIMHPDDLLRMPKHFERLAQSRDGDVEEIEYRLRHPDGSWHWFEGRKTPFKRDADGRVREIIGTSADITARKASEEATARLAAIVESSADALFSEDLDGIITSWNRGAEQIFGYTADEMLGSSIMRLIPNDHREDEHDLQRRIVAGDRGGNFEALRVAQDGHEILVSVTVSPLKDAAGNVIGTSRAVRDITSKKLAEESLRQNATLFSAIIDRAPMGTYVIDADFRVHQVNAEAMPAFATVQPLIGRDFHEVLDIVWGPDVGGELERIFRHTLRTGDRYVSPRFTELRNDLNIEQSYEWETQRITLPDGRSGVVCYFHEVTERALAMRALQTSEQRIRLATEATQVGIWEWNVLSNTIRWDAQMFRIYGLTPTADGLVDYSTWSRAVLPEDLAANEAILHDTVRRHGRSERSFRITRRDDGAVRHVNAVETVRTNTLGEGEWVVGTNLDVSERVQADKELRRLAAELAATDRRKDEFLATLAHELRNPLAPIRNGLHILQISPEKATIERVRAMMERQLGQMVHMVDDLLDLSRINQGKLELRKEGIELGAVLVSAIETSRPLIDAGGHMLAAELPPTPIFVDADFTRLGQVFSNILNNAAKYSERGGRITLTVQRVEREIVVRITDTGIGIPADMLPKIFQIFTQVDRSLEKAQGGLGIGLALVRRLVEMHGGRVEARSAGAGAGSEFAVYLPELLSVAHERPVVSRTPTTHSARRFRILVADDNRDSAETMSMMLTMLGHDVRSAYDGLQAVTMAAAFTPDIMLLDIGMPEMNGLDVCRHVRQQPWGAQAVLVALTGWGQDEDKRRSFDAGFNHHFVKPVAFATLESLLSGENSGLRATSQPISSYIGE